MSLKSIIFSKPDHLLIHVVIWPGKIFSFWKIVGNPSKKRGFVQSRSIVNGETLSLSVEVYANYQD